MILPGLHIMEQASVFKKCLQAQQSVRLLSGRRSQGAHVRVALIITIPGL